MKSLQDMIVNEVNPVNNSRPTLTDRYRRKITQNLVGVEQEHVVGESWNISWSNKIGRKFAKSKTTI